MTAPSSCSQPWRVRGTRNVARLRHRISLGDKVVGPNGNGGDVRSLWLDPEAIDLDLNDLVATLQSLADFLT